MTLCPRVGGTLSPTLESSSGPGWVVQEKPAADRALVERMDQLHVSGAPLVSASYISEFRG